MYLSLALHNHQPVGNFGWVFEEAYQKSYLPMIECLERHPDVRLALHYTGPLRDWLLENKPDFFPRIRALVEREQIEILSGAYYEPVLAALPDKDKVGQIQKQTDSIKGDFGYDPTGMWLAERIWEPHLARSIAQAGVQFTIVDDTHFKNVGYVDEDLLGYYVTEEQGNRLRIFATPMLMRELIPWKPVPEVIDWLRVQAGRPDTTGRYAGRARVAIFGDDGEKFGLWPGTYSYIWEEGWMERFFTALEENQDWLITIPPGDFAREHSSLGRVYLPTASYQEIGEWSLPPDGAWELPHLRHTLQIEGRNDITHYMRGGLWRSFMVKYEEVNQLHKKALWVSRKVHSMEDGALKTEALNHLWAGQCNCGYWHGVFGGVYLFHIRVADYQNLIQAENLADKVEDTPFVRVESIDFDHDGVDDLVIATDRQNLILNLNKGGSLIEWDYRLLHYNLLNVMTRRCEGYHRDLIAAAQAGTVITPDSDGLQAEPESIHSTVVRAREGHLEQKLIYDWHRRASLLDHFLGEDATLNSFYRSEYPEQGDFINQAYLQEVTSQSDKELRVRIWRDGKVWQGASQIPVHVEKVLNLEAGSDSVEVAYHLRNDSDSVLDVRFGIETNWGFAGGNDSHTHLAIGEEMTSLAEIASASDVSALRLVSELWNIRADVDLDLPATVWRFPLESVSASEAGFESNYQGTTMLCLWPILLQPGESWRINLKFQLGRLRL